MQTISRPPHVPAGRVAWRLPTAIVGEIRPALWLLVGLIASAAYLYGARLIRSEGLPSPLFVPQAIILSVLIFTPPRQWWLFLLVAYVFRVTTNFWLAGAPLWFVVTGNVPSIVEPLVGALLLRAVIPLPPRFASLREVSRYAACVIVAAMVGATLGATIRLTLGDPFWHSWPLWFMSDALASLLLGPTIMLWIGAGRRGLRTSSRQRTVEVFLLSAGLVLAGVVVFGARIENPDLGPALLYAPVPLLLWVAVRFGPRGLASALSLVTVFAIAAVANGLGPFVAQSTPANVLTLQLFLFGVGVPLFFLSALVQEGRQTQERYRGVVQSLPHGVVLLFGPDLRHVFADGQGLPDLGASKESIEGKDPWEAFPPNVASALVPRYELVLSGRQAAFDLVHADRTYHVQVLLVSHDIEAAGMVVMQDVTEQRRAEELAVREAALRATNKQLETLSRAKSEFLSIVSHEVRTPLGSIRGFSEMLRDDSLGPEECTEYAGLINVEAQRLGRLVEDLLDLDRLESGQVSLQVEMIDPGALIAASLERAAPLTNGHTLHATVEPSLPRLRGDRDKLAQVVGNLIGNAIKYSPDGGTITVGAEVEDELVHLWVQDEGIGIPPEMLESVFVRYARVESPEHRAIKGTGLGLPIVRQIAELHGGRAWAESQRGYGSRFHVTLPIAGPPELATIRDMGRRSIR